MNLVVRTCTYYGEPVAVNGLPTRSGYCRDVPAKYEYDGTFDMVVGLSLDVPKLTQLVEEFEDEYGCKVSFDDPALEEGVWVYEFDVFEPSWPDKDAAREVVDELGDRLVAWFSGSQTQAAVV